MSGDHAGPAVATDVRVQDLLPVGLSFYVLQCISYLVDVSRRQTDACRDTAGMLEALEGGTHSNRIAVAELDEAMGGLEEQAAALREEVARFRI